MSEELKPCPFQGHKPTEMEAAGYFRILCACGIVLVRDTREEAVEAWNTRNDRAVIDGFLARVRDELKKGYFTREQIVSLDLIFNIVAAEMFGKEGE